MTTNITQIGNKQYKKYLNLINNNKKVIINCEVHIEYKFHGYESDYRLSVTSKAFYEKYSNEPIISDNIIITDIKYIDFNNYTNKNDLIKIYDFLYIKEDIINDAIVDLKDKMTNIKDDKNIKRELIKSIKKYIVKTVDVIDAYGNYITYRVYPIYIEDKIKEILVNNKFYASDDDYENIFIE